MNAQEPQFEAPRFEAPHTARPRYAPPGGAQPRYAPYDAGAAQGARPGYAEPILLEPGETWYGAPDPDGPDRPRGLERALDRVLSAQRPAVLAHLRSVRLRHPDATPAELVRALELRYLALVTTTGAGVGASSVIPGIGTGAALALAGAETVGFLEATALFAQSVAEVHGLAVDDPDRARALVMGLMLGQEGSDLVSQFSRQAAGGAVRANYWGEIVVSSMPRALMNPLTDQLKKRFVREFSKRSGASVIGKALPFGVGAAIGGVGNNMLGRRVVKASRTAFGPAPFAAPLHIEPREGAMPLERRALGAARKALPRRGGKRAIESR